MTPDGKITLNQLRGAMDEALQQIRKLQGPSAWAAERAGDEFKDALSELLRAVPASLDLEVTPRPIYPTTAEG